MQRNHNGTQGGAEAEEDATATHPNIAGCSHPRSTRPPRRTRSLAQSSKEPTHGPRASKQASKQRKLRDPRSVPCERERPFRPSVSVSRPIERHPGPGPFCFAHRCLPRPLVGLPWLAVVQVRSLPASSGKECRQLPAPLLRASARLAGRPASQNAPVQTSTTHALFSFKKFCKIFQILRHIESLDVCMKY